MLFNFAIFNLAGSGGRAAAPEPPRLYPAERLTDLRSVPAALADLETEYEIEREELEAWSGSDEMRQQLLADLEERRLARREPYRRQWERLVGPLPDRTGAPAVR